MVRRVEEEGAACEAQKEGITESKRGKCDLQAESTGRKNKVGLEPGSS